MSTTPNTRPPLPTSVDATAKTTKVAGYYNNNPFPIIISSSQLGINQKLDRGEFLKDGGGRKINDPRLAAYVGSHMLSVEVSAVEVPILYVGHADGQGGANGFSGVATPQAPAPAGAPVPTPTTPPAVPAATMPYRAPAEPLANGGVRGMSIEAARKAGLLDNVKPLEEQGVPDTLDPAGAAPPPLRVPQYKSPQEKGPTPVPTAEFLKNVETPVQGELVSSLIEAAASPADDVSDVAGAAMRTAMAAALPPAAPTAPVTPPPVQPPAGVPVLPPPQLDGPPAPPAGPTLASTFIVEGQPGFTCPRTGKKLQYRSVLVRHLQTQSGKAYTPEEVSQIIADTPITAPTKK